METIESIINDLPTCVLLSIGRRVYPAADAVQNWDNRKEPHYFRNPETLIEAICRAWQNGNYQQKRIIVSMIDDGGL